MLILSRRKNESVIIGEHIEISVVDIKGEQVKLGIKAPRDVKVFRHEIFLAIQQENRAAAQTPVPAHLPSLDFEEEKKK